MRPTIRLRRCRFLVPTVPAGIHDRARDHDRGAGAVGPATSRPAIRSSTSRSTARATSGSFPTRDLACVTSAARDIPNPMRAADARDANAERHRRGGLAGTELFTLYTVGAWSAQGSPDPPMVAALIAVGDYTTSTADRRPARKLTPTDAVLVIAGAGARRTAPRPLDGVFQTSLAQTGDRHADRALTDTAVDKTLTRR